MEPKLSNKEQAAVSEVMKQDYAAFCMEDFIQATLSADCAEVEAITAKCLPNWSKKQILDWVLVSRLDARRCSCLELGVARRLSLDKPEDLAAFASLHARIRWAFDGNGGEYVNVWPVLHGLAAGDLQVARRFAETGVFPLGGTFDVSVLYNGVYAAVMNDIKCLRAHVPAMSAKKPPAWLGGMYTCLVGIAKESPKLVAEGLETLLRSGKRIDLLDIEKIINMYAHGIFELCRSISPELVSRFDIERPLPWDAALQKWVRESPPQMGRVNLTSLSPVLHDIIVRLKKPSWWDASRE